MTDASRPTIAEITHEALSRCEAIGAGALEAVEALRACVTSPVGSARVV
ncbi:hypothetical protein IAG44_24215 [Streptomyces roseirectus]|uniref:Uncharacterized protein n=1 Tax=Streptomyces roseirectus TaxID=2768066 RepID=A0A7H0IHE5_9ACTN|nr:hypothetical protein [Streptomyces roseirectus]QNP72211.1 hypothetical protein IAG44_24215 [Streptomyces roseirectus]